MKRKTPSEWARLTAKQFITTWKIDKSLTTKLAKLLDFANDSGFEEAVEAAARVVEIYADEIRKLRP